MPIKGLNTTRTSFWRRCVQPGVVLAGVAAAACRRRRTADARCPTAPSCDAVAMRPTPSPDAAAASPPAYQHAPVPPSAV